MKDLKIIYHCLIILCLIAIFAGCKSNSTLQEKNKTVEKDSVDETIQAISDDSLEIVVEADAVSVILIPSPDEILQEVLSTDIKYDMSILNPLSNEKRYLSIKYQALNLGIYLTDLAYINLSNDKTRALQYFITIRDLAQKLNIYQPFYGEIYNRIQKNIAVQDSLNVIFGEMYYSVLDILEATEQNDIYAFIVTGALVESLFIPAASIKNSSDYELVASKMFEQKYIINNFYDHLSKYKNDKNINEVLLLLKVTKDVLNKAGTKTSKKVILQNDSGNFTLSGGDDIVVTEQMFRLISEHVKKIRSEIVNSN